MQETDFLAHPETHRIIREALQEDIKGGDHSSLATVPEHTDNKARCLIKDTGILAGVSLAKRIFEIVDENLVFTPLLQDGDSVQYGDIAFYVDGSARSILAAERTVLNFMQRMSGIATYTRRVVDLLQGLSCQILDTRKTTPLIRHVEKWAVRIGGGTNHRLGLYDMIMIKDNHIDYSGGITQAISACHQYLKEKELDLNIEVEARTLEEVKEILAVGGVYRIMLDNMALEDMRKAVAMIGDQAQTEASGGITMETVRDVAETGVDFISMGALTHSVKSMDISLKAV